MGDIIKFPDKIDPKVLQLVQFGNDIDMLIVRLTSNGLDLFEAGAIVANRLGEVLRHLPEKEQYADIFIDILLKKAELLNG